MEIQKQMNTTKEIAVEPKTGDFDFKEHALKALLSALYYIFVYIPFIFPFLVWGKAASRLSSLWDNKSIKYDENKAQYPAFYFYFNYLINFVFDAYILLIWPLGLIYVAYQYISVVKFFPVIDGLIYYLLIPLFSVYASVIIIRLMKEALFFILNNLITWIFNVIINIGKLIKNAWLLNIVIRKKDTMSIVPAEKSSESNIDTTDI